MLHLQTGRLWYPTWELPEPQPALPPPLPCPPACCRARPLFFADIRPLYSRKKSPVNSHWCSSSASSNSRPASRSKTILRMLFRFAILLSISRISALHIFFRMPIISKRWFSRSRSSFRALIDDGRALSLSSSVRSFWPLEPRLRWDFRWSWSDSGREAWKPWNRE